MKETTIRIDSEDVYWFHLYIGNSDSPICMTSEDTMELQFENGKKMLLMAEIPVVIHPFEQSILYKVWSFFN